MRPGRRALGWVGIAIGGIALAAIGSSVYYAWSVRARFASLPERCRAVLAILPSQPPPPSPEGPGILWRGVAIPLPAGDRAPADGQEPLAFRADGIRAALIPCPADLPVQLLREELRTIGGDPSRAPGDPAVALRRIGWASTATFRFHLRRAILEERTAELLAKLRLIPIGGPTRMGWSEDPPGLWAASEGEVWALRLLPDASLILRAEREDPDGRGELGPWLAAFGCRWNP